MSLNNQFTSIHPWCTQKMALTFCTAKMHPQWWSLKLTQSRNKGVIKLKGQEQLRQEKSGPSSSDRTNNWWRCKFWPSPAMEAHTILIHLGNQCQKKFGLSWAKDIWDLAVIIIVWSANCIWFISERKWWPAFNSTADIWQYYSWLDN